MVQISQKLREYLVKVCEESEDKFSSTSVGQYYTQEREKTGEKYEFALICVKVVPNSICELKRIKNEVNNNGE